MNFTKKNINKRLAETEKLTKELEQLNDESSSMLQSIFRVAPTGIGVVVNRVVTLVNKRILEITGYTKEELIGQNALMLYPTREDYEYVGKEKYDQIKQKGTGEVETRWQKKDGTILHVLLSSTPIHPEDHSKGVVFTALDISERHNTQEKLQEKMNDLKKFNKLMVGRENRMLELKQEVNELLQAVGKPAKYNAPEKKMDLKRN